MRHPCKCYSNPTPVDVQPPGADPVMWQEYAHGHHNCFMIGDHTHNQLNYRQTEVAFITTYLAYIMDIYMYLPPHNSNNCKLKSLPVLMAIISLLLQIILK